MHYDCFLSNGLAVNRSKGDLPAVSGCGVDEVAVVLTPADTDLRVMCAFAEALTGLGQRSGTLVWRVVDGLRGYVARPDEKQQIVASLRGVDLDWIVPEKPLSQMQAVVYGLGVSHEGNVIMMNPDMPDNLRDVERFMQQQSEGARLVFARRVTRKDISLLRHWMTAAFSSVARWALSMPVHDFNSSMVLVSSEALARLHVVPADCPVPYLFVCHALRFRIAEVPIEVCEFPGKKSSFSWSLRVTTSLAHFHEMYRFRIWMMRRSS
jgi:hypothetical protein